ncbi:MAG: hypothetical protein AABX28_02670 [Nanoarchaeota archaeon]
MKHFVFFEALILTVLILSIGIFAGFFIESWRTGKVVEDYKKFEIGSMDLKLQNYYFQIMDSANCEEAKKQNLDFADGIYSEGLIIQRYEDLNQLSDDLILEKKKYVLLDTELWLNSILLREKCGDFHNVVYAYTQYPNDQKKAEQEAISKTLEELKKEMGNEIILIPIAGDLGLKAVELQMKIYNVTYYPSIIIDEEVVLEGFHTPEEIKKHLN